MTCPKCGKNADTEWHFAYCELNAAARDLSLRQARIRQAIETLAPYWPITISKNGSGRAFGSKVVWSTPAEAAEALSKEGRT